MKKIYFLILAVILIIVGFSFYFGLDKVQAPSERPELPTSDSGISPQDTTYLVEGEEFHLVNGSAKKEIAPGSATVNELTVFGEPAFGDIDGDGDEDAVVILVNNPGGSGSFFYGALAINVDGKYRGTDAILLGDRIAPQTYQIVDDHAEINYAVRKVGEDFTVPPSVGQSLFLKYDPKTFRLMQIEPNFSGEANPAVMKLDMQPWTWLKTDLADKTEIIPKRAGAFKLTFQANGTMSATTDCNSIGGTYEVKGQQLTFGNLAMTEMFCADSQEQDFVKLLNDTESYSFTGKGELLITLKSGLGTATFR